MDDSKTKSSIHVRKNHRSKSSYSDTDEKKPKRKRSNSYRNEQEDAKSNRSKPHQTSRSASRSRSYESSRSNESSYSRSYRSRSISRSPDNKSRRRKSKHRRRSMSWSNHSSPGYDGKDSNLSPPRHSKDKKKSKDPRDKSKRECWKNKVYIVGEIMKDCAFHFCDTCQMPIFIYCRLIPCKHIFCYSCGTKYQEKKCPRCDKKVLQVERCNFGSIFMCYQGGAQHGSQGCRRTYLSQRDLDSHINHRHAKIGSVSNQQISNNPCSIMSMSGPPPLNMLGSTFINSFPGQFQQQQIQSMLQQQQQMPINSLQNQQMASMNSSQTSQMIRPMGNMLASMNNQSHVVNQQQINPTQSQMVNHQQNYNLQIPSLNMMPCNMSQNTLSMVNQNTQNIANSVLGNVTNNVPGSQMLPGNGMVTNSGMFMQGGGQSNAGNQALMRATNSGYSGAGQQHHPPLMAHLSSLLQQQQQQHAQSGRQFQDLQRHLQMPSQTSGWINQGQINPGANN